MEDDVAVKSQRIPLDSAANLERPASDRDDPVNGLPSVDDPPADDEAVGGRDVIVQMNQAEEEHLRANLAWNGLAPTLGLCLGASPSLTSLYWFECTNARSGSGDGGRSKRQAREPAHVSPACGWMSRVP